MAIHRPSVAEIMRSAAAELTLASDTARLDAELLMAHALDVSRSDVLLRHMGDPAPEDFEALVIRRMRHEPVAYIIGRQEFYGIDLKVTPDVLIPRGDSETLIETARELFAGKAPQRILDLGTGSGALLLASLDLWQEADGVGIDMSGAAMKVAEENAQILTNPQRAKFVMASWNDAGWTQDLGIFNLILCNPPYVETAAPLEPAVRDWEPGTALFAGEDGLDDYHIIIPQLRGLMARGGAAILEIGHTQDIAVSAIAEGAGLSAKLHRDLGGRPRALALTANLST